jgi:plastocyanin
MVQEPASFCRFTFWHGDCTLLQEYQFNKKEYIMAVKTFIAALMIAGMVLGQLSGCGDSSSPAYSIPPPPPPTSGSKAVSIMGMAFSPGSLTVAKDSKVIWTNNDQVPHTATSNSGSWDTGIIQPGASDTLAFVTAGTFPYHCAVHPMMKGTVTVQ